MAEVGGLRRDQAEQAFGLVGVSGGGWRLGLAGGGFAEGGDVFGGAAFPGFGAGEAGGDAEIADDVGDDVGEGAAGELVVEVGGFEALVELGAEVLLVGRVLAVDGVFDLADDLAAGDGAGLGGLEVRAAGAGSATCWARRTVRRMPRESRS